MRMPIFPLPNVVLFPRAVLPLHIFEERYRAMTAAALESDGTIAMALLKPGWEFADERPDIFDTVCTGTIRRYERLPDGRYNLLLEGAERARIVKEHGGQSYRVAELELLKPTSKVLEIDLEEQRRKLRHVCTSGELSKTPVGEQLGKLIAGPIPTGDLADVLAFHVLEDVPLKQSLLEEADVLARVDRVVRALAAAYPPEPNPWAVGRFPMN